MAVRKIENKSSNGHGSGRVKFRYADSERYVDLDMENANAEVADGIKSLANALSGRQIISPPRALSVPKAGITAPPVVDQEEIPFPPHGEAEEETEEPGAEASDNGNGSGTKRSYSYKTPKFQNDLDIAKAKKDLKGFMAEKNPSSQTAKYLAVVYWLQKFMDVPEVTIDHVYTIFDILGWKSDMPSNPSVPLRDLKSKAHMLTREPNAEGYKLNFKGEQEVEKMK